MTDIVSRKTRSRMMSGIRGKDTKPELLVRRGLHKLGFRFRLHVSELPGKPDLVLPKYRAVILVHGCFWHGHHCHLFKWPETRTEFWKEKISGNKRRDDRILAELTRKGWRVLCIWECALKGKNRLDLENVLKQAASWIVSGEETENITGEIV